MIDLAAIDAVGFDLDHTLALYDDAAVNGLAAASARRLLVERFGYPASLAAAGRAMELPRAGRSLAADLRHGAIVKLDSSRRVSRARLAGRWLHGDELTAHYEDSIPESPERAYTVYSPFELPVLWLLEELELRLGETGDRARRCEHVRSMLDVAHTDGTLKARLRADLPRFVSGIPSIADDLVRWRASGKQLFVVTNSEPDFAVAVLGRAIGPGWREVFRVVVTGAGKPAFFHRSTDRHAVVRRAGPEAVVLDGGSAGAVESILGVSGGRVLFVGDNPNSDIRSAHGYGWRTTLIVPELRAPESDSDDWGAPLLHEGTPTWLSRMMRDYADIVCDRVDRFLALDPHALLTPLRNVRETPGAESP